LVWKIWGKSLESNYNVLFWNKFFPKKLLGEGRLLSGKNFPEKLLFNSDPPKSLPQAPDKLSAALALHAK
jgi:hypothetical protein